MKSVLQKMFRTKSPESVTSDTNLHRCLGIVDLIVIGLGGIIGSGIYVMTGITAKEQAGKCKLISSMLLCCFLFDDKYQLSPTDRATQGLINWPAKCTTTGR